jgi:small-conductance mechanosensitive channel
MKELFLKQEVVLTILLLVFTFVTHRLIIWSTAKFSKRVSRSHLRKQYLNRYTGYVIWSICILVIILLWSITTNGFWVALSSTFAVVGVALFANWSILSNVTASFILYFTYPYKIGDRVRIHDKDLPITATISDIKGFYTLLITIEGEVITYPNNLLLQKGVSILKSQKDSIFDLDEQSVDKTI